jgi:O-antigen ligase
MARDQIPQQYTKQLLRNDTIFTRLEFYRVARQVFQDKPLFGLGFNTPIKRYISGNYEPKFYPSDSAHSFASIVAGVQTFDNMALFFIGQTGILFSLAYLSFGYYLFKNLFLAGRANPEFKTQALLQTIVLIGFYVHSMTYHSLRYPHLNWLFNSLLGLAANHKMRIQTSPGGQ